MKNVIKVLWSLSLFFIAVSCSDDDGGASSVDANFVGTWDLIEVNVSSSVDLDGDGSSSTNLLDEEDCIVGTLILKEDMTWEFQQSTYTITFITNDLYHLQCSGTNLGTGAWASNGTQIAFQGSTLLGTLQVSNNRITKNEGEELPGIQSYVYLRRE